MILNPDQDVMAADLGEIEVEQDQVGMPGIRLLLFDEHLNSLRTVLGYSYVDVGVQFAERFLQ
jgi:hypothetical protein